MESAGYYDQYWLERDARRSEARSRRRAGLAVDLLGERRGTLLELGCGPGWALETFREAGFSVKGVDVSTEAAERARERGLDVAVADITRDPLEGSHDVVVALEVLEHVSEPASLIAAMGRLLKPDGCLVISLPNEFTLNRRVAVLLGRPGFGGHDDPHLRHFSLRGARRLFEATGLEILGRAWDGLCPPRFGALKALTEPLARVLPGMFALSGVYLLKPGDGTPSAS